MTRPILADALKQPYVRSMHHAAFRSGQWAEIVGIVPVAGSLCWLVVWPDGHIDEWVIDDPPARYERAETRP